MVESLQRSKVKDIIDYKNLIDPNLLPQVGSLLGYGIDGQVYSFQNEKIIKISRICSELNLSFFSLEKILSYLKNNRTHVFASVYDYGYLGKINNDEFYYYISEKLKPLSEDEKKVFHTLISHEDRNIVKNYSDAKIKKILFGLMRGLDVNPKKVIFFCTSLRRSRIKHLDLHSRNIMKNNNGDFKLIDFTRIKMEND